MRMRSQRDMRSMLSKAALKSTNAMYNVRLCSLHFSIIFDMLYPRCTNLTLNIRDPVSLMGRGSSVVGAPHGNVHLPNNACFFG